MAETVLPGIVNGEFEFIPVFRRHDFDDDLGSRGNRMRPLDVERCFVLPVVNSNEGSWVCRLDRGR